MTSRRKLREKVFRLLFQIEVGNHDPETTLEKSIRHDNIEVADRKFYRQFIRGVTSHYEILDRIIEKYAKGWRVERIARADLTILRMALYELLFGLVGDEGEPAIVINEAVLLAKNYSGAESGRFVNGILGNVSRDMDRKGFDISKLTSRDPK